MAVKLLMAIIMLLMVGMYLIAHSHGDPSFEEKGVLQYPSMTTEQATFGGGCFWCMEAAFEVTEGVTSVTSGYTGGTTTNPTYEAVSSGTTGHYEAVKVLYDPAKVTYQRLLDVFWRNINPTQRDGQFADRGSQYRTAIFYHTDEQRRAAETSKHTLAQSGKFGKPIVTDILPTADFYPAEEYHQDYYKKHLIQYQRYKHGSGREAFLHDTWGDESR